MHPNRRVLDGVNVRADRLTVDEDAARNAERHAIEDDLLDILALALGGPFPFRVDNQAISTCGVGPYNVGPQQDLPSLVQEVSGFLMPETRQYSECFPQGPCHKVLEGPIHVHDERDRLDRPLIDFDRPMAKDQLRQFKSGPIRIRPMAQLSVD